MGTVGRRGVHVGVVLVAALAFAVGCFSIVAATKAYDEAGRWFARATFNAECGPGSAATSSSGCLELSHVTPDWPSGVEVTDQNLLLAEAAALHNTGSGVLTLGGLLLAVAAILVSAIPRGVAPRGRPRDPAHTRSPTGLTPTTVSPPRCGPTPRAWCTPLRPRPVS